jgi:hypothetical protein
VVGGVTIFRVFANRLTSRAPVGRLLVRRGRMMLAVPILARVCVLGYAVAWFAMSGKP